MVEKATVRVSDEIELSRDDHEKLMKHLQKRLEYAAKYRDSYVDNLEYIDRQMAGYQELDADDRKRQKDNIKGEGVKPVSVNLQLSMAQIDESVTFLMSVIAPDDGMYSAIAPKDQQDVATGFTQLMNIHAKEFRHYRNMGQFFLRSLKYNMSAMTVEWMRKFGSEVVDEAGSARVADNKLISQGNELKAMDMYNFLFDPSVDPVELAEKGEFFAFVETKTEFQLKKLESDGEIFNVEDFAERDKLQFTYFHQPPTIKREVSNSHNHNTNWLDVLSAGEFRSVAEINEFTHMYCWLIAENFGLKPGEEKEGKNKYTLWRFTLGNNKVIAKADELSNAHGMLPVCVAVPVDDGNDIAAPSYGEQLIPLQQFASHAINIHQNALRKKLFGITIYNKNLMSLNDSSGIVSGVVPVKPMGRDFNINNAMKQFNDAPNTERTMDDVQQINDFMQKILPTQQQNQVASLERATQYQAAAVVQGANRRNLKIAKLINDQAMNICRRMQLLNIYQFQESTEIISNQTGEVININPSEFRKHKLEFKISEGLLGLDRLLLIETYKDLINMVIQNQVALQRVDMIALLDYFTNIIGDKTDFKQFEIKSEIDNLPPELKDLAFQLLQQAQAAQEGQTNGTGAPAIAEPVSG